MRVLIVNNWHRSGAPSGVNRVVRDEIAQLREAGLDVEVYERSNDSIDRFNASQRALLPIRPIVSLGDAAALRDMIRRFKPDIAHVHNVYPLLSPWVVRTAHAEGIPVIQTVHDFLHECVQGLLFRDGGPCRDCHGTRTFWPGVVHGCYRTRPRSAVMATSLIVHRSTWRLVDRYIAISQVVSDFLVSSGIPGDRITVKHNLVPDPGPPIPPGRGFLFAARLRAEKGIGALLEAWKRVRLEHHGHLVILGDGADAPLVSRAASADPRIEWRGNVALGDVAQYMRHAAVVVAPSLFDEPFGLTVVEALAHGRPVIVGNRGAPAAFVPSDAGWITATDPVSLAAAFVEADQASLPERSVAARRAYEANFSPAISLRKLLEIYERTLRDDQIDRVG